MFIANTRWIRLCAASALLAVAASCSPDDLLKVDNPDEIQAEALNDVSLLEVQLNGVIDAFQGGNDFVLEYAMYPTDEVISGLNWETYARANQRIISYLEGPTAGIFEGMSRGLRMGHDLSERIRGWATDDPSRDFSDELSQALVFAGYSAVILAENTCQGVISPDPDDPSGTVLSQEEVFAAAIPYLTEAMNTATDADVVDLARTGLARAHLGRQEWSDAANFANMVTPGFQWWLDYTDISGGRNPLQNTSNGGNFTLGIHPWFTGTHPSFDGTGFAFEDDDVIAAQTDPRVQHHITDLTGHNGLTRLYKLIQGLRYSEYTGETIAPSSAACPACTGSAESDFETIATFATDIMMAGDIEAQHHYHEALAMMDIVGNEATIQAFVNARRTVGNQPGMSLTGQALITELRNQRGKDLFMGGFRLGDLRRWTKADPGNGPFAGGSYFPEGTHPNSQWGAYDAWTCFPIPLSEYEGNENLTSPTNPSIPPAI